MYCCSMFTYKYIHTHLIKLCWVICYKSLWDQKVITSKTFYSCICTKTWLKYYSISVSDARIFLMLDFFIFILLHPIYSDDKIRKETFEKITSLWLLPSLLLRTAYFFLILQKSQNFFIFFFQKLKIRMMIPNG